MKKRKLVLLLALVLTLAFALPVSAAKLTKQQKAVKTVVVSMLKNCKNYNAAKIRSYFVYPSKIKVFYEKVYSAKFMKKLNKKHFEYEIGKISVSGSTAKVTVTISYASLWNMYTDVFNDIVIYMLSHPNASSLMSDKYTYKRMLYYYSYFDAGDYEYDEKITLSLKKVNGKWKISSMPAKLLNAIHGDYAAAYNDYFN